MRNAFSIVSRDDTMFGACHAMGEDFGFNPVWLRLLFALLLFFHLPIAIASYAALTLIMIAVRVLVADPAEAEEQAEAPEAEEALELPLAA